MAKRLKHKIGTDHPIQFTIQTVAFDGTKTPKDLTGLFVYLELEREGVQVLAKDNDGVGGVTLTDAVNGVCVATILFGDLVGDVGGEVDYAVLVREGAIERGEPIRGKMDLLLAIVDVP
jgi:hypothetical protein